jgi:hypothetical protein
VLFQHTLQFGGTFNSFGTLNLDDAAVLLCELQTLKEVMGIRPLYNLNPSHVGVLYQLDK